MNKIAKILNKNRSTISRKLKINTSSTGIYYSLSTHKKSIRRKSNCHLFSMLKYKNFTYISLDELFLQFEQPTIAKDNVVPETNEKHTSPKVLNLFLIIILTLTIN